MVDILHRIGVRGSSPDDVYAALTTLEGLSGWWARDTTGVTDVGGVIAFRFVPGGFDMKVIELVPGKKVLWEVVEGPAEWVGTQVSFELSQAGDFTVVLERLQQLLVDFQSCCSEGRLVHVAAVVACSAERGPSIRAISFYPRSAATG